MQGQPQRMLDIPVRRFRINKICHKIKIWSGILVCARITQICSQKGRLVAHQVFEDRR